MVVKTPVQGIGDNTVLTVTLPSLMYGQKETLLWYLFADVMGLSDCLPCCYGLRNHVQSW